MVGELSLSSFLFKKRVSKENILIIVGSLNIIIYTGLLHFFYKQDFSVVVLLAGIILFAFILFLRLREVSAHLISLSK